ncbi:MAG: SulP family inorganic anion transporter [Saprospiraceae bacterium]|nr:SulP family inorganic anion transporter [Saprospiraceae bacterium]
MEKLRKGFFGNLKNDLPASLVVFLVAVPLCLGIAMASGAPLFSGIIAGIIGGIVVGVISGSPLGVSGPAAGLAVIVLNAITDLGSFEVFLLAVVLAGVIQFLLGIVKAGIIGYYFPNSVIKGMLAGIGVIIILKQIPHGFGYDADYEGDMAFLQSDGHNSFSELYYMLGAISPGATTIFLISLGILLLWEMKFMKQVKLFNVIQGPLVAVTAGILFNLVFTGSETLAIASNHLVTLPVAGSATEFVSFFTLPDFTAIGNPAVWITAVTIAVVASLETLLCVEATDKLDPYKRITPTNRELLAQGTGNFLSGLIGGIPVTQVIVRSSANIQSGGRTKAAAVFHGVLLLGCAMFIPNILNLIPLASLAAILLVVGYKLAKPATFRAMYRMGWYQFIPFVATVLAIVLTDLLIGISIGLAIAIFFILRESFRNPYFIKADDVWADGRLHIQLSEEVSFIKKGRILNALNQIPDNAKVTIDASNTVSIDQDVLDIIYDFEENAESRNIDVQLLGLPLGKPIDHAEVLEEVITQKKEAILN